MILVFLYFPLLLLSIRMVDLYIYIILKFMYTPSDYVEVEIRQEKSKYKIRETGSIMKIILILLPINNFCFSCITEACKND